ncbi:unnamed protein product [Cuscuta campestris]|uniref:3'-5' exonuclease domain-containing protein n=1 Tax=Cuscuta campestris TaxID=132261 RepID=A0A484K8U8_9ASTE|nr:unnamed protein product [Cuscuta campestris]
MVATLHNVVFHGSSLNVTVTKCASEVDRWITATVCYYRRGLGLSNLLVGLDIEWHPCKPWETNPVATLQLCVEKNCLIFQILKKDFMPCALRLFLRDPFVTFVGVGVREDAEKLFRDCGLVVTRVMDLRPMAASVYRSEAFLKIGLKKMAMQVLGAAMEKPLSVTLSDWDAEELSFEQIEYGAIDAFVSFLIGIRLLTVAGRLPMSRRQFGRSIPTPLCPISPCC